MSYEDDTFPGFQCLIHKKCIIVLLYATSYLRAPHRQ